jgi:hypothetical protein
MGAAGFCSNEGREKGEKKEGRDFRKYHRNP